MRQLCSKWVLCLLTVNQNQHINVSKHCLQMLQCNKKEFLHKYVTMDETWIYHFTLESNQQSAKWTAAGESRPKWPKTQISAGKVFDSAFWDMQGILFIDYLGKGRTINSKYYIASLVHLKEEITKKMATNEEEKSALSPRQCTMSQVDCNNGKTTWIALWIAFTPTLFSRSGPQQLLVVCKLQKNAQGKRFVSSEEVILETKAYFEAKDKSFYKKGIELLEKRWNQCITLGDYIDE